MLQEPLVQASAVVERCSAERAMVIFVQPNHEAFVVLKPLPQWFFVASVAAAIFIRVCDADRHAAQLTSNPLLECLVVVGSGRCDCGEDMGKGSAYHPRTHPAHTASSQVHPSRVHPSGSSQVLHKLGHPRQRLLLPRPFAHWRNYNEVTVCKLQSHTFDGLLRLSEEGLSSSSMHVEHKGPGHARPAYPREGRGKLQFEPANDALAVQEAPILLTIPSQRLRSLGKVDVPDAFHSFHVGQFHAELASACKPDCVSHLVFVVPDHIAEFTIVGRLALQTF
mmetsp:Transcript_147/g.333  ORF Transcript_147/g.333 Transcript_147/m.333 type:complete len:280 (-) Transcript_147:820-1659(-)